MMLLDAKGPIDYENRITLGQVIEVAVLVGGFAWTLIRKYLKAEETDEKVTEQSKMMLDFQSNQTRLTGVQANQQTLIEQQDRRLTRLEAWRDRGT